MSALQAAIDAINAAVPASADDSQQLVAAKCRGLMRGYDARWRDAGYSAISIEQVYSSQLYNPSSGRMSRTFETAGKIDVLAQQYDRRFIVDHKFTSNDITDPNSDFYRQLVVASQPTHYMTLLAAHGIKVDGAIWDCIRRPTISQKKLSAHDRQSVVMTGSYCGKNVSQRSREALQSSERETLEMYEVRLSDDCTTQRPEFYFSRRAVPRLDSELIEYAQELWDHAQDILTSRNKTTETGRIPPRSPMSCLLYNSACRFLGVCSGHDTPDSRNWRLKAVSNRELPIEQTGRDILTNSRVSTFTSCKRKHFYEYELGIERIDEEEKEVLWFGTLGHLALEAWWNCFLIKETDDDSGATAPSANGAGIATAGGSQTQLAV